MNVEHEADRRVAVGAALLDAHFGPGWAARIDLNQLDLPDGHSCILGQLFDKPQTVNGWCRANFSLGIHILDLGESKATYAGFVSDCNGIDPDYVDIDAAWARLIKARHNTGVTR